jgi:drug/metabolite transporter (DMT)-like permease
VLTRLTLQYFSAFSLGFIRYFIASCVLVAVALITKMKVPSKKDLPLFFAAGASCFFLYMIAFNQGQGMVGAATASVIIATVPVITAFFARFVYSEKLSWVQWLAILIEFIGVVVLASIGGAFSFDSGMLWLLFAAVFLSVYNLLQRKLTKQYSALQTSTYSIFFGTLMLAIFAPASVNDIMDVPYEQFIYLTVLGVFSSAIAYVSWAKAFSKARRTSDVSNYMFVTPFLTSVLGFLIAGEVPDKATLVGGSIILAGVMIFNFGGKRNLLSDK